MGNSGSKNGGTVPHKAIFCGDIPLHRPYVGRIYVRYLQFSFLKWPWNHVYIISVWICVDMSRMFRPSETPF